MRNDSLCVAVCCSVLQCVAVCCSFFAVLVVAPLPQPPVVFTLNRDKVYCSVLQCDAVWCNMLQCVAACCSVLQRVAACRSVLQCAAVCCSAGSSLCAAASCLCRPLLTTVTENDGPLQQTATHSATHCNNSLLQHTATYCNTLQHRLPPCRETIVYCNTIVDFQLKIFPN